MTQQTRHSPPTLAKAAKNGNLILDLGDQIDSMVDELAKRKAAGLAGRYAPSADYRGRFGTPAEPGGSGSLGLAKLVSGEVKPVMVLLGGGVGVPVQQLGSRVILQQALGASPLAGDGVMAGATSVLHFLVRSSFTFGMALANVIPLASTGSMEILKAVGLVKTTVVMPVVTAPPIQGVRPPMGRALPQTVRQGMPPAPSALASYRSRLAIPRG